MAFKLANFGTDSSNSKSILGGISYYRYYNENDNNLTAPGYFPASLGLGVGDRICVIPSVTTDEDDWYVVASVTNGVVTVAQLGEGAGLSKVVHADTLPTASAVNEGQVYLYTGATDASYTHGYVYECQCTPVYTDTTIFTAATLSGTVVTATAGALSGLAGKYIHADVTKIVSGTLTYDLAGELWIFYGYDSSNTEVGHFQLYQQDYVDAGFTFTGTPQDGDVVAFTTSISVASITYSWARVDTQPQPTAAEIGAVTQTQATITLVAADWSNSTQSKTVTGVTPTNTVIVAPAPTSAEDYASAGILCTAQTTNTLTFTCSSTPASDISVSVVILN